MPTNEEIIRKHEILKDEARELEAIESTSVWQKMKSANEEIINNAIDQFANGTMPKDPMAMAAYFLDLRSEVKAGLRLINLFNDVKTGNVAAINSLLGGKPLADENEDGDLDAKTQY